jgi:thiamine biosynthesis lipoprotein
MGCETDILVVDSDPTLIDKARQHLAHLERCWTRFNPDSDLSRINTAGGQPVTVDPSTITLLTAMVNGWAATGGAFNPTLLAPLVNLGYHTSWTDPTATTTVNAHTADMTAPTTILLDVNTCVVQAPAEIGLDAGGVGKGFAADLTVALLVEHGPVARLSASAVT